VCYGPAWRVDEILAEPGCSVATFVCQAAFLVGVKDDHWLVRWLAWDAPRT